MAFKDLSDFGFVMYWRIVHDDKTVGVQLIKQAFIDPSCYSMVCTA